MDIVCIGDEDTVIGFKMAGVKDALVFDEQTIKEDLENFKEAKVIILTETVAEHLRSSDLMDKISASVAEVPDKSGSKNTALKNLSKLFEEAIGVKLKGAE